MMVFMANLQSEGPGWFRDSSDMGNLSSAPSYGTLVEAKRVVEQEVSGLHQKALALYSAAYTAWALATLSKNEATALKASETALAAAQHPFFFNRHDEVDMLLRWLGSKPNSPIVITGPKDSGKTILLKHIQAVCQKLVPVLRIDMKGLRHDFPEDVSKEIKDQLFDWIDAAKQGNNFTSYPIESLNKLRREIETSHGLGELISLLRRFVVKNGARVVIMLDEAHCLKTWQASHAGELSQLLQFLAWMTRQEGRNHVLLASSDDFFCSWLCLQERLQYRILGLGNFNEDQAKSYFKTHCFIGNTLGPGYATWESNWEAIFSVTGGSPSQLKQMAQSGTVGMLDWPTAAKAMEQVALEVLTSTIEGYITEGAEAAEGEPKVEVKVALEKMLTNRGIVPFEEMVDEVFKAVQAKQFTQVRQRVLRMVELNLFHLRHCTSGMAYKDMEHPANCMGEYKFLMPYRPADLKVMETCLKQLEEEEEEELIILPRMHSFTA